MEGLNTCREATMLTKVEWEALRRWPMGTQVEEEISAGFDLEELSAPGAGA
jgi:hypothetical protein